ncbi:hypothetical protein BDDG_07297 [Blastomyces dermatitidis ATCC 18188]|uniref:Uncharacterized protein n=1 Tax=Ajellomyces dermatitidis (strain ATCC 18188 / CBS 674.68) TaxID=653446 RepID=F2TM89_AJEDA|nr:hypothetical protein BDDG_07297 [Blastomyces dermatitidis ATCC 18188]
MKRCRGEKRLKLKPQAEAETRRPEDETTPRFGQPARDWPEDSNSASLTFRRTSKKSYEFNKSTKLITCHQGSPTILQRAKVTTARPMPWILTLTNPTDWQWQTNQRARARDRVEVLLALTQVDSKLLGNKLLLQPYIIHHAHIPRSPPMGGSSLGPGSGEDR